MPALAWAEYNQGEQELRRLSEWVSTDRAAIDIGSNQGIYSWTLAPLASHVHAFEPQPELAARLRKALPSVTVHAIALSDQAGTLELKVPVVNNVAYKGWATLESEETLAKLKPDAIRSVSVRIKTLDQFDIDDVGFIKIDVEGHEFSVLRGGVATLRRCKPVILFEATDRFGDGRTEQVHSWLKQLGYVVNPLESREMWLAVHNR